VGGKVGSTKISDTGQMPGSKLLQVSLVIFLIVIVIKRSTPLRPYCYKFVEFI
jgi:hypothetical protein